MPARKGDGTGLSFKNFSEVRKGDGTVLWTKNTIPDSDIYLHDDFGDGKLQNRDGSDTTTHNGVTGTYRPEWTFDNGSPTVINNNLRVQHDTESQSLYSDINIDLSQTTTWEWTNIDRSNYGNTSSTSGTSLQLFAGSNSRTKPGFGNPLDNGYYIRFYGGSDVWIRDTDGNVLVSGTPSSNTFNVTVTRSGGGQFELFIDGTSAGTATDTSYTTANYIGFGTRNDGSGSGADMRVSELKVS